MDELRTKLRALIAEHGDLPKNHRVDLSADDLHTLALAAITALNQSQRAEERSEDPDLIRLPGPSPKQLRSDAFKLAEVLKMYRRSGESLDGCALRIIADATDAGWPTFNRIAVTARVHARQLEDTIEKWNRQIGDAIGLLRRDGETYADAAVRKIGELREVVRMQLDGLRTMSAQIERMRPVVEAAGAFRKSTAVTVRSELSNLEEAWDAYEIQLSRPSPTPDLASK